MTLTQRQSQVAQRLVGGMTIAAIADDLGLTESRVNQIIRALKNRFDTDTQAGIVAAYQHAVSTDAIDASDGETKDVGDESLVPEILNTPHPILYRFLAIAAATLLLTAVLWMISAFVDTMSELATERGVTGLQASDEQ